LQHFLIIAAKKMQIAYNKKAARLKVPLPAKK
jgi:hypothetical protein